MSRKITQYITFLDKTFVITQGIFTWEPKMISCLSTPIRCKISHIFLNHSNVS